MHHNDAGQRPPIFGAPASPKHPWPRETLQSPPMSYQVLARKYRPRKFQDVVGQDHAVRALVHGLDADRLHHAYLFTGTRGVGKTTLARAFANCLNCEQGVSSTPCGECGACTEITAGRFVDLIEVDAASRTGVEATRELLDNAQYMPARGRFKVYLIDEVHMLSTASFNALLKTLEEPPPHVKFLLATTDPRKVPITVLSRCLQFNLKNILPERIAGHLGEVLEAEAIAFEPDALQVIALAAQGSMRDALSIADQAVSFGGGALKADEVATLLGVTRGDEVAALLGALADGDKERLLGCAADLAERGADFADVLANLQRACHDLAMAQAIGGEAKQDVRPFVERIQPEDVQLYYQVALLGGRDLQYAADPRVGFEMTLIRMVAFRPEGSRVSGNNAAAASGTAPMAKSGATREAAAAAPAAPPATAPKLAARGHAPSAAAAAEPKGAAPAPQATAAAPRATAPPAPPAPSPDAERWHELLAELQPTGMAAALLRQCLLVSRDAAEWKFLLDNAQEGLLSDARQTAVRAAVCAFTGRDTAVSFEIGAPFAETPAQREERVQRERQAAAEPALLADEQVQALQRRFDARVDAVRPLPSAP